MVPEIKSGLILNLELSPQLQMRFEIFFLYIIEDIPRFLKSQSWNSLQNIWDVEFEQLRPLEPNISYTHGMHLHIFLIF